MPEYREGPEAKAAFGQTARIFFQSPKPKFRKEKRGKETATTVRKPVRSDKD